MTRFNIAPDVLFLDRAQWGADLTHPRLGFLVPRDRRTHVIFHHTVIIDNDATPNLWESEAEVKGKMFQLQTIRPDLGLDVPYILVVFLMADGGIIVCEGRGEDRTGAHTKGHNTAGVGIAIEGNLELLVNMVPYIPPINKVLRWLKTNPTSPDYGPFAPMVNLGSLAPVGREVFEHQDFSQTACAGRSLREVLPRLSFDVQAQDPQLVTHLASVLEDAEEQAKGAEALVERLKLMDYAARRGAYGGRE